MFFGERIFFGIFFFVRAALLSNSVVFSSLLVEQCQPTSSAAGVVQNSQNQRQCIVPSLSSISMMLPLILLLLIHIRLQALANQELGILYYGF